MPDIFLSYAHEDMDRARDIASALDAQGWSVFWDRRIPPGRAFEDFIEQQINESALVVVLWSPHSVGSNWVRIEAAHARDRNPPALVPILIAPATIPFAFSNLHAADLCHWRPGQKSIEVEELFRSIESLVRRASHAGLAATDDSNGAVPASTRHEPHMNIAIIGATGHGKTTLTAAIASTLAKSSPQASLRSFDSINGAVEEKARGMSGAAALVEYRTARHRYVQADFLCHEDCIDSMLAAAGMDGMILVVATSDGATQQTREQILAARQGGVACVAVALNKVDLAGDAERLRSVELEVRDLLTEHGFPGDDVPIVQISACGGLRAERQWEKRIEDLVRAVDQRLSVGQVSGSHGLAPSRGDARQPLLIPVENVHFLQGRGALATGRIERGVVKVGDRVEIVGLRDTRAARVSGVEILGAWVDEGRAGDIVGLLLPATPVEEIERGQVIALPESVKAHARFEATVFLLGPEEGVGHADVLSRYFEFQFRTARVRGSVTLPEGVDNVLPGDVTPLSVELMAPVVMTQGSRFLIRKAARIVGAGTVSGAGQDRTHSSMS